MEDRNYKNKTKSAVLLAIFAAVLYGISAPASKLLLIKVPPALMAALLYLGAGFGMLIINLIITFSRRDKIEAKMTYKEMPFIVGMIVLDIIAPIMLMIGLTKTTAGNTSLLNNFEIVATTLIALFVFKEAVGRRMWMAIAFIVIGSIVLSVEDVSSFSFSVGSVYVILASIFWGLENNCTRMLSLKDPLQIVVIKGFGSGIGALLITVIFKSYTTDLLYISLALLLGFIAYGLSIYTYIIAQRYLGATRTSAYYAAAPFVGVLASWAVLKEPITSNFLVAIVIMLIGAYFAVTEDHRHKHQHDKLVHEHKHAHDDGHHNHIHDDDLTSEHSHMHSHEVMKHIHSHTPDLHHKHTHD